MVWVLTLHDFLHPHLLIWIICKVFLFQHCWTWSIWQEVPFILDGGGHWVKCCLSIWVTGFWCQNFTFLDFWQLFGRERFFYLTCCITWIWARLETIFAKSSSLLCLVLWRFHATLARHLSILKFRFRFFEEQDLLSHAFLLIFWAFMPNPWPKSSE